jgi:hypothetical protein
VSGGGPFSGVGMTKSEALAMYESKWWEGKSAREIAEFQMNSKLLCCPFDVFHEALEKALRRPVWTHELGLNYEGIKAELTDKAEAPTMQEIIDLLPADKTVIVSK